MVAHAAPMVAQAAPTSPVADGLTVYGYDLSDIFDCPACLDTGRDPDCDGHRLPDGRVVVCGCPACGGDDRVAA